jgi:uncharacterized protein (TIGR02598 family)
MARRLSGGFSLVEVVLAIGIVGFAFVAMFGLLPVGLSTFRQAVDNSVGSQIVQRLINDAQQTDYPELIKISAAQPSRRYFDDQGNEVTSINDSIYTAELTVIAPTSLPNTSTPPTDNLATVIVKLANNPAHNATPFDPGSKIAYSTYSALIARNQ